MISHLHLGIERQSIIEKHYDSRKLRLISDFFKIINYMILIKKIITYLKNNIINNKIYYIQNLS